MTHPYILKEQIEFHDFKKVILYVFTGVSEEEGYFQ